MPEFFFMQYLKFDFMKPFVAKVPYHFYKKFLNKWNREAIITASLVKNACKTNEAHYVWRYLFSREIPYFELVPSIWVGLLLWNQLSMKVLHHPKWNIITGLSYGCIFFYISPFLWLANGWTKLRYPTQARDSPYIHFIFS